MEKFGADLEQLYEVRKKVALDGQDKVVDRNLTLDQALKLVERDFNYELVPQ